MHRHGRTVTLVLIPILICLPAAGCTQNSAAPFHAYQPTKGSAEPVAVAKEQDGKVASEKSLPVSGATTASIDNPKVAEKNPAPSVAAPSPTVAMVPAKTVRGKTVERTPAQSASASAAAKGPASSTTRQAQVLIPNKTFRREGADGALRVSYDDIDLLKVLNMDPVTPDAATLMPPWLKALDGHRIRIRGFMYPTFQQTGVHAFGLARDNQICCFGRNPKIYDVFDVVLHEGTTTDYIPNRPFDVVGVFHIRPEAVGGSLYHLYEMDDAAVITK